LISGEAAFACRNFTVTFKNSSQRKPRTLGLGAAHQSNGQSRA
jgi:hypothetical protein